MTFDSQPCHFRAKIGNANLRLSGFAVPPGSDQIGLFVSLYKGAEDLEQVQDSDTKTAADQCYRYLACCASGRILKSIDESNDAYHLAAIIHEFYPGLDQIRWIWAMPR